MIFLASKSPRRRELLKLLDITFEIAPDKEIEEIYPPTLEPKKVPEFLSQLKSKIYLSSLKEGDILITADTIVIIEEKIIGKPVNKDDAKRMLRLLSGKTHQVVTGVTITSTKKSRSFSVTTNVTFALLSDAEIDYYLEKYKPYDKAGAYGIQEWIGAVGISGITGSFYNVMGLPVHRLYNELQLFKKSELVV